MTLEEAIQHCKEEEIEECKAGNTDCADEHRQLVEWLTELLNNRNGNK